jgi:hypothetical protein
MNEIESRKYCLEQAIKFYADKIIDRGEIFSLAGEIYDWVYLRGFAGETMSVGTSTGNTSIEPDF